MHLVYLTPSGSELLQTRGHEVQHVFATLCPIVAARTDSSECSYGSSCILWPLGGRVWYELVCRILRCVLYRYAGHVLATCSAQQTLLSSWTDLPALHAAYFEVNPKQQGFDKRRDLYLVYHYLNHYNLFGSGYLGESERLLRKLQKTVGA